MGGKPGGGWGPKGPAAQGCPHCGQEPSLLRDDGLCYYAGKLADLQDQDQAELLEEDGWRPVGALIPGHADLPIEPWERREPRRKGWRAPG